MEDKNTKKKKNVTGRDASGKFIKGVSGNPNGRPRLPKNFFKYAEKSPDELFKIATNPEVPLRLKSDILMWFCEMYYGKATQQMDVETKQSITSVTPTIINFEGELEKWSK